jgi:hypothetical protein
VVDDDFVASDHVSHLRADGDRYKAAIDTLMDAVGQHARMHAPRL